jgi:hypothetical protein
MSINVVVGRRPDGSSRRWTEPSTGCWRQGTGLSKTNEAKTARCWAPCRTVARGMARNVARNSAQRPASHWGKARSGVRGRPKAQR